MSNGMSKLVKEQINLLEIIQKDQEKQEDQIKSMNYSTDYSMLLSKCITHCQKSVFQIAAQMTELLNRGNHDDPEISHHMIYSWTGVSKLNHEPKASWLPALCKVIDSFEPLEFLVRKIGLFIVPGEEALRAEINRLHEEKNKIVEEIEKREFFLKLSKK